MGPNEFETVDFSTAKAERDILAGRLCEAGLIGNIGLVEKPLGSAQYYLKVDFVKAVEQQFPVLPAVLSGLQSTVTFHQPKDFAPEI